MKSTNVLGWPCSDHYPLFLSFVYLPMGAMTDHAEEDTSNISILVGTARQAFCCEKFVVYTLPKRDTCCGKGVSWAQLRLTSSATEKACKLAKNATLLLGWFLCHDW